MQVQDVIGRRWELIAALALTRRYHHGRPRFEVRFLGEKAEVVDFLVELQGEDIPRHFFLVQVKSTGAADVPSGKPTLPISVSRQAYQALCRYRVPCYLIGVDEVNSNAFLLGLNRERNQGLGSFPTRFPLSPETLEKLFHEVRNFWERWEPEPHQSQFQAGERSYEE